MKKLFPDVPDVSPSVANRAVRIVERHLRTHRVSRAKDLPEEARIRLYRDLRLFFEGDQQSPDAGGRKPGFSVRAFLSGLWEKIEDFLSASEGHRECRPAVLFAWAAFGESARFTAMPLAGMPALRNHT